jgi:hypothetical protein
MSNLGFEPEWVSSTTRNLTSWAKPTLSPFFNFDCDQNEILEKKYVDVVIFKFDELRF